MGRRKLAAKEVIEIQEVHQDEIKFYLVGTSPLIMHRFPFKAWQEMLLPSRRMNQASLEQTLKHNPMGEYRESFYRNREEATPTLFHLPNGMLHGALAAAALDIPGSAKAQILRLTRIVDININLYGIPQMFCAMVRNSGINRAPDVRTRPIFPQWACSVTVRYASSIVTRGAVGNLMGGSGVIVGIGDWRIQKGGPFGGYRLTDPKDKEWLSIFSKQGRRVQQAAFDAPGYYDQDTEDLMTWYENEIKLREQPSKANGRHKQPRLRRPTVIVTGSENEEAVVGGLS